MLLQIGIALIVLFDIAIQTNNGAAFNAVLMIEGIPGESSSSMNQRLDGQLQSLNFPSGIQYDFIDGWPTIWVGDDGLGFKTVSVRSSARAVNGIDTSGLHVGFVMQPAFLLGDINCDGVVNLLDVAPFIELLTSGGFSEKGDFNGDGLLNLLDVSGFVDALTSP